VANNPTPSWAIGSKQNVKSNKECFKCRLFPIIGARNFSQFQENLASFDLALSQRIN